VCGSLVLAGAATAQPSAERQTVIVECDGSCEALLPPLRRMGAEIASSSDTRRTVSVRIATERLPEIPMIKGVLRASKDPLAAPSRGVQRRRTAAERRRGMDVANAGPRLVAPGKALALNTRGERQVRTARTPDGLESVQRSADVETATAEGIVAQNDVVPVLVDVPAGTRELSFVLLWENDSRDDVDLIVLEPDGNAELSGVTLRSPERAVVKNPQPGVWTAFVNGFAMHGGPDQWQLGVAADGIALPSR
jgi:hypothetical protein